MTEKERADAKIWIEAWRRAGPELEKLRSKEIGAYDTPFYVACMETAFRYSVRNGRVRMTSGLTEQQALFMKLRNA